jgi:hypothetical protein
MEIVTTRKRHNITLYLCSLFCLAHQVGLGALYGPFLLHIHSASVHCTDLFFFTYTLPRYTVRTFFLHIHSASVHCTDLFSSHTLCLGALYGPFFLHIHSASVHCTDPFFFTYTLPRCTVRTLFSSHTLCLGALCSRENIEGYCKLKTPPSLSVVGI